MRLARFLEGILTSLPDLINISITASYIILAIILVRFLFRKAPKQLVCAMWGIAALRLMLPFSIESVFSLIPATQTIQTESLRYQGLALKSPAVIDVVTNPVYPQNFSVELHTTVDALQDKIMMFTFIWISGVVLLLLYAVISATVLKRKVSTATLFRPGIKQTDTIDSPFLFGIFKPIIYIPYNVSSNDLEYVIAHEQAHIKRKDYLWKPLGFIILSVYWFNPIIWIAYVLLCKDIEAACDEKVIRDMQDEDRRSYSTALLNCSVKRPIITACPLAFGEVSVKDRISNVMNYKKPGFWVIVIAVILCIVLAVCFLTNPSSKRNLEGKLGISMDMAVIEQNKSAHSDGNYSAIDYDVLRISKTKDTTTVYAWVFYEEYSFDGEEIRVEQGSNIPSVVTFDTSVDSDTSSYDVIEYWIPRDGSYYVEDIREKFPIPLWRKAMNCSNADKMKANCMKAAEEYYAENGVTQGNVLSTTFENILGFSGYSVTITEDYGWKYRTYFIKDGNKEYEFARSYGFDIDDYAIDIDKDGKNELICNCVAGGDGHQDVYIYRLNKDTGVIEVGVLDGDKFQPKDWLNWGVNSMYSYYSASDKKLYVKYTGLDEKENTVKYDLSISDIENIMSFTKYYPNTEAVSDASTEQFVLPCDNGIIVTGYYPLYSSVMYHPYIDFKRDINRRRVI